MLDSCLQICIETNVDSQYFKELDVSDPEKVVPVNKQLQRRKKYAHSLKQCCGSGSASFCNLEPDPLHLRIRNRIRIKKCK
jgi:hypothetical protein